MPDLTTKDALLERMVAATDTLVEGLPNFACVGKNAGGHNSVYRGKNIGASVTEEQYAEIDAGTFFDMYIGDFWRINNVTWRIAAFDYWFGMGDTACTTHHVLVVPDSNLATAKINGTSTIPGGYVGSDFYTGDNDNTGKATAETAINNAFGSVHILSHRERLSNAVTDGYESASAWYDSTLELMTEQMVFGGRVFDNVINGTNIPAIYTIDNAQLPLFRHNHSLIRNGGNYWLRNIVSAFHFSYVGQNGQIGYYGVNNAFGIRPVFAIKA